MKSGMKQTSRFTPHPNNRISDSRQTTSRKNGEGNCDEKKSQVQLIKNQELSSTQEIQKYIQTELKNDIEFQKFHQEKLQSKPKYKPSHQTLLKNFQGDKENLDWLRLAAENYQQEFLVQKSQKQQSPQPHHLEGQYHLKAENNHRKSQERNKAELLPKEINSQSTHFGSNSSSIHTYVEQKSELPSNNIKQLEYQATNTRDLCNFQMQIKETVKNSQLKAQTKIQQKLVIENSSLKAALEDSLTYIDHCKELQKQLKQKVQNLEFEKYNLTKFNDTMVREQEDHKELLKVYETLLTKLTEQNKKLKVWIKVKLEKEQHTKNECKKPSQNYLLERKGSLPLPANKCDARDHKDETPFFPPQAQSRNESTIYQRNYHHNLSAHINPPQCKTYRELSVPKQITPELLHPSTNTMLKVQITDLLNDRANVSNEFDLEARRISQAFTLNFDNHDNMMIQKRAEPSFGKQGKTSSRHGFAEDQLQPYEDHIKELYKKVYEKKKPNETLSVQNKSEMYDVIQSITSLDTSFRELNLDPSVYNLNNLHQIRF